MQKIFGYARVSSRDQNEERQIVALRKFPVERGNIFIDKQSGKDFQRPMYKKMIRKMKKGDLLVVTSIDRLGRNYAEIQEQWKYLTKELKIDIVVLDMPLLDTRERKDLIGKVIADIMLQLLSYVAQTERENIRQRQAEGIRAAKKRGIQFGRVPKVPREKFLCYLKKLKQGDLSEEEMLKELDISRSTFRRYLKKYGEE